MHRADLVERLLPARRGSPRERFGGTRITTLYSPSVASFLHALGPADTLSVALIDCQSRPGQAVSVTILGCAGIDPRVLTPLAPLRPLCARATPALSDFAPAELDALLGVWAHGPPGRRPMPG